MNFLIIDCEFAWDDALHEAYRLVEPGQMRRRVASKRIIAAAALDISLSDTGTVGIAQLTSWTEHDWGSGDVIAANLLDHICFRPDHQVVTWGGLATDLPVLVLTAFEADLVLPPQLRAEQRIPRGGRRPHLDLALAHKAQGRDWCHLSEILIRLGLSPALMAGKANVGLPRSCEQWETVRRHVELDTVFTAIALLAWMKVQGTPGIRIPETITHLVSWFLRNCALDDNQRAALDAVCAEMEARIAFGFAEAA